MFKALNMMKIIRNKSNVQQKKNCKKKNTDMGRNVSITWGTTEINFVRFEVFLMFKMFKRKYKMLHPEFRK